jgi:hypothetical protein
VDRDQRDRIVLRQVCVVAGCNGIMSLHEPLIKADAPHTLEWPWYATWVCEQNSAHIQVITNSEYAEIRRLLRQQASKTR